MIAVSPGRGSAPVAALVSFRLGRPDGVSVEARHWGAGLSRLGWQVRTVAGAGTADVLLPGLDIGAEEPPGPADLAAALDADLVVVENVLSLPLNLPAAAAVAGALRGRAAILRHHDLAWQRPGPPVTGWPYDDPGWLHVTINDLSRRQLAERGIAATTVRNTVELLEPSGSREATRRRIGVTDGDLLVMQPTRAIPRKNVPAAVRLSEALGATFWLTGPTEEGYADELARVLHGARCRVVHRIPAGVGIDDAYAACDLVSFPSTLEGFGNPLLEAAVHRRPIAVGRYPVLDELRAYGFWWLDAHDPEAVRRFLAAPQAAVHDHNAEVVRRHFSPAAVDRALAALLYRLDLPAEVPVAASG
jgi:mannosylglucosylglycerate synthase